MPRSPAPHRSATRRIGSVGRERDGAVQSADRPGHAMLLPSGAAVPKPLRKAPAGVGTRDPRDQRGQRASVPQAALSRGGPSKRAVDARAICAANVNALFILAGGEAIESPECRDRVHGSPLRDVRPSVAVRSGPFTSGAGPRIPTREVGTERTAGGCLDGAHQRSGHMIPWPARSVTCRGARAAGARPQAVRVRRGHGADWRGRAGSVQPDFGPSASLGATYPQAARPLRHGLPRHRGDSSTQLKRLAPAALRGTPASVGRTPRSEHPSEVPEPRRRLRGGVGRRHHRVVPERGLEDDILGARKKGGSLAATPPLISDRWSQG